MLGDGAKPRRPGGGTPGMISGTPGAPVGGPVSAWSPLGAAQDAFRSGFGIAGAVPSAELDALGVPGAALGAFGAPGDAAAPGSAAPGVPGVPVGELGVLGIGGVPGVGDDRLEGGAAPSPTSGSMNAPGVGGGTPAGPTSASSCPLVNLMP